MYCIVLMYFFNPLCWGACLNFEVVTWVRVPDFTYPFPTVIDVYPTTLFCFRYTKFPVSVFLTSIPAPGSRFHFRIKIWIWKQLRGFPRLFSSLCAWQHLAKETGKAKTGQGKQCDRDQQCKCTTSMPVWPTALPLHGGWAEDEGTNDNSLAQ